MFLCAAAPTVEGLKSWLAYQEEKQIIVETDYSDQIDTPDDINRLVARNRGISLENYKEEMGEEIRQNELHKLNEKYGIIEVDEEEEDERLTVLRKYQDVAKRMEQNESIKKMDTTNKMFQRPETLMK